MIVVEESAEGHLVRSADLEIRFRHVGDRWQHSISIRDHGESFPLMTSDEGSPEDEALPSPALQDLRLERLSADVVEFQLLGQARKEIYSAAVRFDGAAQVIDLDLCSRRRAAEFPLCTASCYTLADRIESRTNSRGFLVVEMPHLNSSVELSPVAIPDQPATSFRLVADRAGAKLIAGCVETTGANLAKKAASVRWKYRMGLADLLELRL